VLSHLLGADETLQRQMGRFLEETWRMRPEVNDYTSRTFYQGRLEPAHVCEERVLAFGAGVRFLPVEHSGHSQASPEEAHTIAAEIGRLLGTPYRDEYGERTLRNGSGYHRITHLSVKWVGLEPDW
jgi:hypothetical protein